VKKNETAVRVEFLDDLFGAGGDRLAELIRDAAEAETPRIFLVADSNVVQRQAGLGAAIGRWVNAHGLALAGAPVILPGGERVKSDNLQSVLTVSGAVLEAKLERTDVLLALGGGAVLDVAGYVAAQIRGGVRLVRVPTTVLAMLDGAAAVRAAVDDASVKDAYSVASVPVLSVIDPGFAGTVLDGVWRAGFAEALRQAVGRDAKLVRRLVELAPAYHDRDAAALREIIESVLALRAKKGASDFALWAALRLQAMSSYNLPHGHAVSIAVAIDLHVATLRGFLSEADRDLLLGALAASGAAEAIVHNRHLFGHVDSFLRGLDAWRLLSGTAALTYPAGPGREVRDENPDSGAIKAALNLIK